jgi:hypothetical protein
MMKGEYHKNNGGGGKNGLQPFPILCGIKK